MKKQLNIIMGLLGLLNVLIIIALIRGHYAFQYMKVRIDALCNIISNILGVFGVN